MAVWGVYLRLSKEDKRGGAVSEANSIKGQRQDCLVYIDRNDPDARVIEFAEAEFITASKGLDRPAYIKMLDAMADGSLDHIVAAKQDRFTRDRDVEFGQLKAYAASAEVQVHAADSGSLFDSADRELASGIRAEFAAFESKLIGRRVKRNMQVRREEGYWSHGGQTFGYDSKGNVNEEQAHWVRWAYDAILKHGKTAQDVYDHFRAHDVLTARGKPWNNVGNVIRMLKNPALAGIVTYQGEVLEDVQARWEPIVTREERDELIEYFRTRQLIDRGVYGQRTRRAYMLAGKVLCGREGCDLATMTVNKPGGRNRTHYWRHDRRKGGCGNYTRGAELDFLASNLAVYFLTNTPAPEVTVPEFDDTLLKEIESQIAEVRAELVAGTIRAADARPVLDGLNKRLEEQQAAQREHEEQARAAESWFSTQATAALAGDHDAVRSVIDNVRVLPDQKGYIFEGVNGATVTVTGRDIQIPDLREWLRDTLGMTLDP
jgi:DNA invertase Pin-like site-specific DNA recombinase